MKFSKDRYSIEEISSLLSGGDPNQKKIVSTRLESDYPVEIFQLLEDLRTRKGYEHSGWKQALCIPILSRDEAIRYTDTIMQKISEAKPKRRGRPESRSKVEEDIEMALSPYKGKRYSNPYLRKRVAEKLGMSPGTLERHYKHCFPNKKTGQK